MHRTTTLNVQPVLVSVQDYGSVAPAQDMSDFVPAAEHQPEDNGYGNPTFFRYDGIMHVRINDYCLTQYGVLQVPNLNDHTFCYPEVCMLEVA